MAGAGIQLFEERLSARKLQGTAGMQFDPATIIMIINAIMALFGGCPKPTTAQLRRRPLTRARLASAIRREGGGTWGECFEHADDALAVADAASDAEKQQFIDDCCASETTAPA